MAKSAFEIRMDYDRAVRQANSLDEIARDLKKTAERELQDCMSQISCNWTGTNSTAYIRKCDMLKSNIVRTAGNLSRTADTIRRIAKNTYDAEMRALEIARLRKY